MAYMTDRVREYGKELLSIVADAFNTEEGAAERLAELKAKTDQMTADEKRSYNSFVNLANQTQTLALKALSLYREAASSMGSAQRDLLLVAILLTAEIEHDSQPIILTEAQQGELEAIHNPKTDEEQRRANRAGLYGVATLPGQKYLSISPEGEYKQPNLLEPFITTYGVNHYIADAELSKIARELHHRAKLRAIESLLAVYRYNALIEAIAESLEAPGYKKWIMDYDSAELLIDAYNKNVAYLCKTLFDDHIKGLTLTDKRFRKVKSLLLNEFCDINKEQLLSADYYFTADDKRAFNHFVNYPFKLRAAAADSFIESVREDIDLPSLATISSAIDTIGGKETNGR